MKLRKVLCDKRRGSKPWSTKNRLQGLPERDRVKEIVDLAYLMVEHQCQAEGKPHSEADVIKDLVVDCSQNICRKPWCSGTPLRTFCTGSQVYVFEADRVLLAEEEIRMHGIGKAGDLIRGINFGEQYDIAGLGMALPAVGLAQMVMLQACFQIDSLPDLFHCRSADLSLNLGLGPGLGPADAHGHGRGPEAELS